MKKSLLLLLCLTLTLALTSCVETNDDNTLQGAGALTTAAGPQIDPSQSELLPSEGAPTETAIPAPVDEPADDGDAVA